MVRARSGRPRPGWCYRPAGGVTAGLLAAGRTWPPIRSPAPPGGTLALTTGAELRPLRAADARAAGRPVPARQVVDLLCDVLSALQGLRQAYRRYVAEAAPAEVAAAGAAPAGADPAGADPTETGAGPRGRGRPRPGPWRATACRSARCPPARSCIATSSRAMSWSSGKTGTGSRRRVRAWLIDFGIAGLSDPPRPPPRPWRRRTTRRR